MKFYNKLKTLSIPAVLLISLIARPLMAEKSFKRPAYKEGEIIVKFKKNVASARAMSSVQSLGGTSKKVNSQGRYLVRLKEGLNVEEAVQEYAMNKNVEYAEPNYLYYASDSPNDTEYANDRMWGLHNTGATTITDPMDTDGLYATNNPGTLGYDMDMESAWGLIKDCSSVTVAVIDSGINYNHEDLAANMWEGGACVDENGNALGSCISGYDFVDDDTDPMDLKGHGTHVAGTIGAVGNNAKGTTGVCWTADIMAVRVLDDTGAGTTADIVDGIDFAVENGAKVINMSLGGGSYSSSFSSAISRARSAGVLVVVAAGNDGEDLGSNDSYPCEYNYDNIICVAAVDQNYELATFSNYGTGSVDIAAPGTNILSTYAGNQVTTTDDLSTWNTDTWTNYQWTRTLATTYCSNNTGGALVIPSDFCTNSARWYTNDVDANAYKAFTLTGDEDKVVFDAAVIYSLETGYDKLKIYSDAETNPYSGTNHGYLTGSGAINLSLSEPKCVGETNCSIGFNFYSDDSYGGQGVAIYGGDWFSMVTLDKDITNKYDTLNGTSMASPHVAGLAAMIWAYNNGYTYSDVKDSIYYGGDAVTALATKTAQGSVVDAYGSLKYIRAPTGLTATEL